MSYIYYKHWSQVPTERWRWKNFSPGERNLACPHCGEFVLHEASMDALQALRNVMGRLKINSGHRCIFWNVKVGGAPLSQHKKVAFDLPLMNYNRFELKDAAINSGFLGLGFYVTFLHVDLGPKRSWFGNAKAEELWKR